LQPRYGEHWALSINLSPLEIVFWRALCVLIITIIIMMIRQRQELKIQPENFRIFLAIGVVGLQVFTRSAGPADIPIAERY